MRLITIKKSSLHHCLQKSLETNKSVTIEIKLLKNRVYFLLFQTCSKSLQSIFQVRSTNKFFSRTKVIEYISEIFFHFFINIKTSIKSNNLICSQLFNHVITVKFTCSFKYLSFLDMQTLSFEKILDFVYIKEFSTGKLTFQLVLLLSISLST